MNDSEYGAVRKIEVAERLSLTVILIPHLAHMEQIPNYSLPIRVSQIQLTGSLYSVHSRCLPREIGATVSHSLVLKRERAALLGMA